MNALSIILAAIAIVVGVIVGYMAKKTSYERQLDQAHNSAEELSLMRKRKLRLQKKRLF